MENGEVTVVLWLACLRRPKEARLLAYSAVVPHLQALADAHRCAGDHSRPAKQQIKQNWGDERWRVWSGSGGACAEERERPKMALAGDQRRCVLAPRRGRRAPRLRGRTLTRQRGEPASSSTCSTCTYGSTNGTRGGLDLNQIRAPDLPRIPSPLPPRP